MLRRYAPRNDVERHALLFSRRVFRLRFAHSSALLEKRAQEKPGADCARSTVCNGSGRTHTGLTGTAETSRPSPRNGLTAYTRSPRGSGLSCPRHCMGLTSSLTPGSRRQDHTTSPYAAAFRRCKHLRSKRPSQPAPTFRNGAQRPLMAARAGELLPQIRIPVKRNIFDLRA